MPSKSCSEYKQRVILSTPLLTPPVERHRDKDKLRVSGMRTWTCSFIQLDFSSLCSFFHSYQTTMTINELSVRFIS